MLFLECCSLFPSSLPASSTHTLISSNPLCSSQQKSHSPEEVSLGSDSFAENCKRVTPQRHLLWPPDQVRSHSTLEMVSIYL